MIWLLFQSMLIDFLPKSRGGCVVYPATFRINTKNGWFLKGGTVESNIGLASISTKIVNSSGSVISGEKTRKISGKKYTVKSLDTMELSDNGVKFSRIKKAGNYKWILTVKDIKGNILKLEMPFKAVSSGSTVTSKKTATSNFGARSNQVSLSGTGGQEPVSNTASVEIDGLKYKLNMEKKTAAFTGCTNKGKTSLVIPAAIDYEGGTYAVTKIAENACRDMGKLSKVTIGKKVKRIEQGAFRDCGKLKTVNIKTAVLTADKVEKNAFKGIHRKVTVNCPASKLEEYKQFLVKKGVPKTATFE